ncbi:threonine-phosphate decarboxylase CobD [Cohnella zeiphila]|uniref:threonine-phosphate decarboxylase n=1 Tax=Cohnella zeiphila TaxID=2761120 RepID=A0A7X0VXJ1_9BACL|nr:threonine-phosphate decarboxylase CobD [Cohnella zeiphila]MBB6734334.1 threonine-phosphate decarboxylase [Cohnella zeiphila]
MLEKYGHGGDWITAEERFGRPPEGWLDYSANMNPFGPPASVERVFRDHWRDIARYPDPAVRALRAKLARTYRIPADAILVGNGAAELIDLAVRGLKPRSALLAQPSFKEYGDALSKAGVPIREWRLDAERDFSAELGNVGPNRYDRRRAAQAESLADAPNLPADGLAAEAASAAIRDLSEGDVVFLGHPNNPTGRLVPDETIRRLREGPADLLLDEAFMDFVEDEEERSLIREAAESERLVVFRSMTKFYAIPGIRLGFLVAHPRTVAELTELQPPWSVNFLAQRIGEAVLDETGYAERTRAWLREEKPWLADRLSALGIRVCPGEVNYLLGELPEEAGLTVLELQDRLGRRGILVRDASLFPGLTERHFRMAVRLREENGRFLRELEQALNEGGGRR